MSLFAGFPLFGSATRSAANPPQKQFENCEAPSWSNWDSLMPEFTPYISGMPGAGFPGGSPNTFLIIFDGFLFFWGCFCEFSAFWKPSSP